ncbi:16S rRNA (cytosine(1402)-N(4))-methyltransferase RsmH [Amorphus orientalis]|uniref:Ribosomal RNA small subunit methyltransferase H n=1 Tax=Amorphus orientalis TaxID=649198 RepID=A0AAE3VNP5_9HYPH|nr:16S rRNA (cytosine(1402)-N(4))-methyltransferase RsmH [Amorphus orientalis]MDQ0315307.1 16S rRNA (cytosine1402-N4)-methyltransferase [Amorphus orientalis]
MAAWDSAPPPRQEGFHLPVMRDEVVARLAPGAGDVVIDGTFGAGGYSRAFLEAGATVIAIDRDPDAVRRAEAMAGDWNGRLIVKSGRFSELDALSAEAGHQAVDGVVLDVGVSSIQLDTAERGFSFRGSGPLDMRMGRDGPSAADLVNTAPEQALSQIISRLGEERRARAVARAIVAERERSPIETTDRLADLVARVVPAARDQIHPATRTFQALRIYVNRELDELAEALGAAEQALKEAGRLVVVAFHSLEDRIVKRFLSERSRVRPGGSRHMPETEIADATFTLLTRKPDLPGDAECRINPRARSARLRAAVRTAAPARPIDPHALGVPRVPELAGWEA